jgi:hypothetical protein
VNTCWVTSGERELPGQGGQPIALLFGECPVSQQRAEDALVQLNAERLYVNRGEPE